MSETTITLQRRQGELFGFKLRRATSRTSSVNHQGIPDVYELTDVIEHGLAYQASLRDGDLLVEVSGNEMISPFNVFF